jgi:hypothetical protein
MITSTPCSSLSSLEISLAVSTIGLYLNSSGQDGIVAIQSFSTRPMTPILTPRFCVIQYRLSGSGTALVFESIMLERSQGKLVACMSLVKWGKPTVSQSSHCILTKVKVVVAHASAVHLECIHDRHLWSERVAHAPLGLPYANPSSRCSQRLG